MPSRTRRAPRSGRRGRGPRCPRRRSCRPPRRPLPRGLHQRRHRRGGGRLHLGPCRDPGRAGKDGGHRHRPGIGRRHPRASHWRRRIRTVPRLQLPHRHRARRIPVCTRHPTHRIHRMERRDAVRPCQSFAVPPRAAYAVTSKKYAADLNEVKSLGGDGVTTPSARTPNQTQNRPLLVGELPAQVEPDRAHGRDGEWARPLGGGPPLRAAQHRHGRWLRVHVGFEGPLRLLAPDHRRPRGRLGRQPRDHGGIRPGRRSGPPRRTRTTSRAMQSRVAPPPKSSASSSARI